MRELTLRHEFVKSTPPVLENGVLYVSIEFATVIHKCCCGCGTKIVTPINPVGWKLTFDGDTVSLYPSIGNGQLPCRSHYWIEHNRVLWEVDMTDRQVAAARVSQQNARERHFAQRRSTGVKATAEDSRPAESVRETFLQKVRRWLGG